MRTFFLALAAVGCLACPGLMRADDQPDARRVVDRALKAMGGAEKVSRFATATFKVKLTHEEQSKLSMVVGEGAWHGLDKVRLDGELTGPGGTDKIGAVINGTKGWMQKGARSEEAPENMLQALRNGFYAIRMPHLLPELRDKAYTLAPQGEQKVDDKETVGLTISHKDRPDVVVHFDKETGLPVKSEVRVTEPGGQELNVEFHFSNYREVDGVKQPMKITIKAAGEPIVVELTEIQAKDKVDESQFAKP